MTGRDEIEAATFEFAHRLIEPAFRDALRAAGQKTGRKNSTNIVVALEDEKVDDVLNRVQARTQPPTLLAIKIESEPSGFGLMKIVPLGERAPAEPASDHVCVSDNATIGMLYTWAKSRQDRRELKIPRHWFAVASAA